LQKKNPLQLPLAKEQKKNPSQLPLANEETIATPTCKGRTHRNSCLQRNNSSQRDLADLKARIIAAVKNIDAPMFTRVWKALEHRIDVCRVTRGVHIELPRSE
jgi:hypothetical protein